MALPDAGGSGQTEVSQRDDEPLGRLAHALRALRCRSGKSLRELESRTLTSDSSLSRYLNGRALPPWSVVEALCREAGVRPGELRAVWETARRHSETQRITVAMSRLRQRSSAAKPKENGDTASKAASENALSEVECVDEASDRSTPEATRQRDTPDASRHTPLGRWTLLALASCLAMGGAAALVTLLTTRHAGERVCPWQYIVSDGVPNDVLIANNPNKGHRVIGTYEPSQIFYVPTPVQVRDGMMRTVDGWITQGNWIVPFDGPCRSLGSP
jgi:transcriptional regulator with XRE-family HTH domain